MIGYQHARKGHSNHEKYLHVHKLTEIFRTKNGELRQSFTADKMDTFAQLLDNTIKVLAAHAEDGDVTFAQLSQEITECA